MPILFAYYSFEGNCRELSRLMADATGGELAEIQPREETVSRGVFMKYLTGGRSSLKKESPELKPFPVRVGDFKLVFVGTPVWAWNMAPPVRTFLSGNDWAGVKVALFAMHGGSAGRTLSAMAKLVEDRGGGIAGAADFVDLRKRDPEATRKKAVAWATEMARLTE